MEITRVKEERREKEKGGRVRWKKKERKEKRE